MWNQEIAQCISGCKLELHSRSDREPKKVLKNNEDLVNIGGRVGLEQNG